MSAAVLQSMSELITYAEQKLATDVWSFSDGATGRLEDVTDPAMRDVLNADNAMLVRAREVFAAAGGFHG